MKRILILAAGLLLIPFCILKYTNHFLAYKAPYGITQFEALHMQKPDTIDVLFVGTSHVYSDINPAVLWEQNGIASFDLATGGANIKNSYFAIEDALETQSPELIVLELYGVTRNSLTNREIMDSHWGLKSISKCWKSLKISASKNNWVDFMLRFPFYHTRYKEVSKSDFEPYSHNYAGSYLYPIHEKECYKGAVTLSHITNYERFPEIPVNFDKTEIGGENLQYLKKIIKRTREENIKLLFIVSPYMGYSVAHQNLYNNILELASENHIDFINFNQLYSAINLIPQTDFAEDSHLSYLGMRKYSEYLGNYIRSNYLIPDRRNEERYNTWDKYAQWEKQVLKDFNLQRECDVDRYIDMINDSNYFVAISYEKLGESENPISPLVKQPNMEEGVVLWDSSEKIFESINNNEVYYQDIGSSSILVKWSDNSWEISVDKKPYKKVSSGINIIVFDKYVDALVDVVGFDSENGWTARR